MQRVLTRHSGCLPEDGLHKLPKAPQLEPNREDITRCRRSWCQHNEAKIAHHERLVHSCRAITTKMEKWECA